MKMMLCLLAVLFVSSITHAQDFGGNPPGKWAQINTDTVNVIFPVGLDSIAQRIVTLAHYLQRNNDMPHRFKKISIVLQNNTTISNAYVALAPYRSEFYLMPPQNAFELGSLNWADNLIIHEWRHVQQYNYFNRGLSNAASIILGQEGRALFNAMAVPDWFFEGDAVLHETRFSQQGRGRLPLAFSGFKSLMLAGKDYSYMKLRNGSLKDLIPDHYELGYLLVAYGAEKYGKDFWPGVTADAASFRSLFYPMQQAIKKHAGISFKQFVDQAFSYYHEQWKKEQAVELNWLTTKTKQRTDYLFPYAGEQDNIIALKQSTTGNPRFISISPDGSEQAIAAQYITIDKYFSYKNGRIVYAAYYPDARWGNRQYSNIILLDVNTGQQKKLTTAAKYFSPDIDEEGKKIVAVEVHASGNSSLAILDENGNVLQTIHGQPGEVFGQPKFSALGNAVYVTVRDSKGLMSLRSYALQHTAAPKTVIPFGNYIIGFPVINNDTITFTASGKANDAVYAFTEKDNRLYQLATYATGLYQSVFSQGKLVSAAFTAEGYRLARINAALKEIHEIPAATSLYIDKALNNKLTINNISTERFAYSKYHKLTKPFNFHSWRPYYDPPEYSFTVYGQNVLNTVATQLAYTYNENENSHRASANLVYGGTYIQPFAAVQQTWNRSFVFAPDTVAHWKEWEWVAGLQLPLELTGGKMFRFLNVSAGYHSTAISFTGDNKHLFRATNIQYVQGRISFSSQLQKAAQHIFPKLAFSAMVQARASTNVQARQLLLSGNMYLPGLFKTHSIVLSAAYQQRDTMRNYAFNNNFPFSRGYGGGVDYPRMWKLGANYHFALLHPDVGLASLVYFLRVRGNAFTDYTQVRNVRTGKVFGFQSVGGEIFFDSKWWNQLPVTFGIRYSRLFNGNLVGLAANQWELILPVDIIR